MSQVPLAPPPPTGGPLDGWLYLLWKRVTAAGQILWSSITPGTSADVAAVVTDETGTAGSLVFSGNPTLEGCYINGIFYQGATSSIAGQTILSGVFSTDTAAGTALAIRKSCTAINGPNFVFAKSRGTAASPSVVSANDAMGAVAGSAFDGTSYTQGAQIIYYVDGAVSNGVVPGRIQFVTANASGTLTEAMLISNAGVVTLGGTSSIPALKVTPVASQARWIEVTGATSSGNPTIGTSAGSLAVSPAGLPSALFSSVASAVNYVELIGVATGSGVQVAASGSDTNISILMLAKGAGDIRLYANAAEQVRINQTASADRYITLTGSNGGNPKIGTSAGQLTLGTGAALATSATEGYVCIPTCAGAPTGVPAGAGAGNLPLIYDTTNNKLYAYNGAWKATAALT